MAGLGNKIKLTVLKGMEVVGQSASTLANNAQHKLQELNLETQRREILSDFPLRAYDLWQKGEAMPEALDKMLRELSALDERLGVLRAQRYAKVEAAEGGQAEGEVAEETDAPALAQSSENEVGEYAVADNEPPADDQPMDEGETGDNA